MSNERMSPMARGLYAQQEPGGWHRAGTGADPAPRSEVLALLRLQPLPPSDSGLPVIEPRWWLSFGWPAARPVADDAPWVRRVALEGVQPATLWRLRLSVAKGPLVDLESLDDGRGGKLPAGDLMASMAAVAGHQGLVMALPTEPLPARLRDVGVELWLARPQPGCRVRLVGR